MGSQTSDMHRALLLSLILVKARYLDGSGAGPQVSKRLLSDPYDPRNLYNFIYSNYYNRRNSRYSFFPKYEPVRRYTSSDNAGRQSRNIHMEYEEVVTTTQRTNKPTPTVAFLKTKPKSRLQHPEDPRNLFRAIYG